MTETLFARFVRAAPDPDKAFLLLPDRAPTSFRDSFTAAARFAHVLVRHGVQPGDRVAVQVEKSPQALFLYLACLRAGAVYLPLNTGYTASELGYFIGDSQPRLFVCSAKNHETIAATLPGVALLTLGDDGKSGTLVAEAAIEPAEFPDAALSMSDLASILYTSGTTGRSKGAMLTQGNLCSNAEALKQAYGLHVAPYGHHHPHAH